MNASHPIAGEPQVDTGTTPKKSWNLAKAQPRALELVVSGARKVAFAGALHEK